jgi:hypothetical protein
MGAIGMGLILAALNELVKLIVSIDAIVFMIECEHFAELFDRRVAKPGIILVR